MQHGELGSAQINPVPWPRQWLRKGRVFAVVMVVFFGLVGCGGVAAGVSLFVPGAHDERAYLVVLLAPLAVALVVILVVTRLRVRNRPTTAVRSATVDATGEPGLVIPYSWGLSAAYVLLCATLFVFAAAVAVASILALVALGTDARLWIQAVVLVVLAVYLGWTLVQMATKRVVRGAVVLIPTGVWHRSWTFDSFQRWDEAVSVSAGSVEGQLITMAAFTNAAPRFTRRSRLGGKQAEYKLAPHTAILGRYLAVDPALAFHALSFYHQNPAARAELGTEAAVHRVRSGGAVIR